MQIIHTDIYLNCLNLLIYKPNLYKIIKIIRNYYFTLGSLLALVFISISDFLSLTHFFLTSILLLVFYLNSSSEGRSIQIHPPKYSAAPITPMMN